MADVVNDRVCITWLRNAKRERTCQAAAFGNTEDMERSRGAECAGKVDRRHALPLPFLHASSPVRQLLLSTAVL